jgi:hypothetical protein
VVRERDDARAARTDHGQTDKLPGRPPDPEQGMLRVRGRANHHRRTRPRRTVRVCPARDSEPQKPQILTAIYSKLESEKCLHDNFKKKENSVLFFYRAAPVTTFLN